MPPDVLSERLPGIVETARIFAGVQFPDVTFNGKTFRPGQANNFYIFPAIGLATYVARPRRLTDACFIAAAETSADQIGPALRAKGMLFVSMR